MNRDLALLDQPRVPHLELPRHLEIGSQRADAVADHRIALQGLTADDGGLQILGQMVEGALDAAMRVPPIITRSAASASVMTFHPLLTAPTMFFAGTRTLS